MNDNHPLMLRCRRTGIALLAAGTTLLVAASASSQPLPRLVSVSDLDSTIVLDIRYAGADNFVGVPVEGYEAPLCLLSPEAARALVKANQLLRGRGYRLRVFDCYRPQRAVDHFVRWSYYLLDQKTKRDYYPNVDKRMLFELGYIASRSGHSRASTVDVGLVRADGPGERQLQPVDMGTRFDFFDPLSHTESPGITEAQRANRRILLEAMKAAGFRNYAKEWWHFTLIDEPYPDRYFDIVVDSLAG